MTFSAVRTAASSANPGAAASPASPTPITIGCADAVNGRFCVTSNRGTTVTCSSSSSRLVPPRKRLTAITRSGPE